MADVGMRHLNDRVAMRHAITMVMDVRRRRGFAPAAIAIDPVMTGAAGSHARRRNALDRERHEQKATQQHTQYRLVHANFIAQGGAACDNPETGFVR